MDTTAYIIIFVSTALAIIFKVVLFKRIQNWMDQDLIKGLADGNPSKHEYLIQKHAELVENKVKRKHIHQQLTDFAEEFEQ
jgi:glycerol kinase